MKIISPAILDAMHRMKLQLGTNIEIAKKIEVSSKHVGKILSEDVKYFEDKTWERIKPLIRPYLKLSNSSRLKLTKEEEDVIKYLRQSENRRQMLHLLLDMEESKSSYYSKSKNESYDVNETSIELPAVAEEHAAYNTRRRQTNKNSKKIINTQI